MNKIKTDSLGFIIEIPRDAIFFPEEKKTKKKKPKKAK